jgi:DNA-binding CsgD family transcriptional regulator/tetratricopeptide (TPR) repeat protein
VLYGRGPERTRLLALLDEASAGRSAALVLRGAAGIGKSALLDELAGTGEFLVLRAQGLESEFPLAFAGVHQLLRPLLPLLDTLPSPQAHALRVAFGGAQGPAVDPFLIALATLALLTGGAESQPVLCLVDDVHWLDAASADALLFTARRVHADRVAFVFTARDGDARTFVADDLPELQIAVLSDEAARSLLAERLPDSTAAEVSAALLEQSGGNPLALLELPKVLTDDQLHGRAPLPAQLHLTDRVQRVFLDRCRRLPEQVQTLLLVTAADDTRQVAVVRRAAQALGVDEAAFAQAEHAGLLVSDGDTVHVRHPLVRSAMYQAATGQERRAAHQALADALDGPGDADRQAWHRAAAADGPDERVVTALQLAAARAEHRGGHAAAAAAYERAAQLTVDSDARAARQLAAARNAWADGQAVRARTLLGDARAGSDDRLVRADIDRLRGRIEVNVGSATTAHHIFQQAAVAVAADDPARALEMAAIASVLKMYGADSGVPLPPGTVDAGPAAADPPRTMALKQLLTSMTLAADGQWQQAVLALRLGLDAGPGVLDPDVLGNLGNAALQLGDDNAHLRYFTAMLTTARDTGAVMLVLYALQRLAFTQLLGGHWEAARSTAVEALALSRSAGPRALTAPPLAWLTLLAALQGRPEYEQLLGELDDAVQGQQLGILANPIHDLTRWARSADAAQHGDAAGALHHLRLLRLPTIQRMAALDRVDAAVRAGDREQAVLWAKDLAEFADATRWPWALGAAEHARGLLADATAPVHFEQALHQAADGGRPYDRARTQLAYGELLRRSQRRAEARPHLRAALATFDDLGAEPLATRARDELRASGETARKRDPSTLVALTPMEGQVARLVAQGLSNKDVAAQLWISPRTVAFHLRGVFAKLGVSSRGSLTQLPLT